MIETKSDILPIKTIYCVTLLALMLISPIANAIQVCTATDQLPNGSESAIKRALLFLSDVVNLNLSQYSVNNIVNTTRVRPDLGNLTENSASMDLMGPDIGTQPHIQFMCINNSPAFFKIRPGSAPLHYTNPSSSDLLKTVQSFLDRYQAFTADPNLSRMKELLINVTLKQPSETTTCKDITLTVKNDADDNSTLFTWRNTFNGVGYSSLQVRFTNGVFSYLFDDTSYFRVGDPTIDVSEQQAIAIGSEYAEKLNLGLPLAKSYFSAKLLAMGTDVDPLTLYPYYEVDLPVYGGGYVVVLLWAKDGKVIEWYDLPSGGGDLQPLTPSPTASSEPTQTHQP
jgi:hypothetical protein